MQEALISIYEKINHYNGDGSFEGWLKKIQINTCLMQIRTNKKMLFVDEPIEELSDETEEENNIYDSIDKTKLFFEISNLPEGYRTIFNLYALDGFTHKEIAEQLGIAEGTSKSQYARAKQILKTNLQNHIDEQKG